MVQRIFALEDQAEACRILMSECSDNLPFLESHDEHGLEPVRFAVLKLSRGKIVELEWWANLAKADWCDVLQAAGFANSDTAHREWARAVYGRTATTPSET